MSVVKGRLYDVLTLPSGRRVHAALVNHIMYGHAGIQKYQMVQETPTRLVCRILRAPEFTTDILTRIREDVQKHLGAEVDIDFEFPEHIAPSPSGKHRFIYSKVAAGAAGAATGADR
jgi:phenylacetate-CoA ligase